VSQRPSQERKLYLARPRNLVQLVETAVRPVVPRLVVALFHWFVQNTSLAYKLACSPGNNLGPYRRRASWLRAKV
jgi:hypothetical protein